MEIEKKNKLAFLQIRRHVGEINWILPIIFTLKKKNYKIVSYFDSDEAFDRLKKNKELFSIWKKINTKYFLQKKTDKILYKVIFKIILLISRGFQFNADNFSLFKTIKKKIYSLDEISKHFNFKSPINFSVFCL